MNDVALSFKPEIVFKKLAELKPYANNAKLHTPQQIQHIAKSIEGFGFNQPIVIDAANEIVAGHGRYLASRLLKLETIPVIVLGDLTEAQKKAFRILDNKLSHETSFDVEVLKEEILAICDLDPDVLADFQLDEGVDDLLEESEVEPGDIEVSEAVETVSKLGDVWSLGSHRVICGSCTSPDALQAAMGSNRAQLVFTDPPYGVSYQGDEKFSKIAGDEKRSDDLVNSLLVPALKNALALTKDDAAFYIWHASQTRDDFSYALKVCGLIERQYLMWVKPRFVFGRADYHWAHEPCFYASKQQSRPKFFGDRKQSTAWHVGTRSSGNVTAEILAGMMLTDGAGNRIELKLPRAGEEPKRVFRIEEGQSISVSRGGSQASDVWLVGRDPEEYQHPTQKPVELARRAIENSSQAGDSVIDLFLGSGSTLIAAEKTGRTCYGCELEPKYVDVIVRRWQQLTGLQAVNQDGVLFDRDADG